MSNSVAFQVYRDPSCTFTSPSDVNFKQSTKTNTLPLLNNLSSSCYNSVQVVKQYNPLSQCQQVDHIHSFKQKSIPLGDISNSLNNVSVGRNNCVVLKQKELQPTHEVKSSCFNYQSHINSVYKVDSDENTNNNDVFDVDHDTRNDHFHVHEYTCDILEHLSELEKRYLPSHTYMRKQREMTPELRAVLVDWLIEVSEDCRFVAETLFLTINYIDRFMSKKNVMKHQLQLVGLAAIFVASKYEEIDAITINDLIQLSEGIFNSKQIVLMEEQLLKTLKYGLNVATPRYFATRYIKIASHLCSNDDDLIVLPHLVYYLTELSLLHFTMIKYLPSQIALACVVLALHSLRKPFWNSTLRHYTKYEFEDIKEVIDELHSTWLQAPSMKYNIVYKKYSRNIYNRVSLIQPPQCSPAQSFTGSQSGYFSSFY